MEKLENFNTNLYNKNELVFSKELDFLDIQYLENLKNEFTRKNKKFNYELEKNKLLENKEKFFNENKKDLEKYIELNNIDLELEYNFNEKKDNIKELKEKRKKLVNENLDNKFFNIEYLEKFIDYLDKNDFRLINDKKNINKLGKDLDLQDKSIYEKIISYFIILYLDKDYFLNLDLLNKKLKYEFTKKELMELENENTFSLKELKSNYLENFNNKYILEYINNFESITKNNLQDIVNLLNDKEKNIEKYKFNLLLLKENNLDKKQYKLIKSKYYKEYNKENTNILNKLDRKKKILLNRYGVFLNELEKTNKLDIKKYLKIRYKKKISILKNDLLEYLNNDYKKDKRIRFLNYLNRNLDLDLDKNKEFKKLKTIFKYELKTN